MSEWVLVMEQRDAPSGQCWFKEWTAIGPCGTWDENEAMRFPSREAALSSRAYSFPLTFYKPNEVSSNRRSNEKT